MSNAEQTLRLLREVERQASGTGDGGDVPASDVTPAALLEALVGNDFDLSDAIVDVCSGA